MADVVIVNNLVYDIPKSIVVSGVREVDIYNNTTSTGYVRMECTSSHDYISTINNMFNNIFSRLIINDDAGDGYIRVISHGNNILGNNPNGSGTAFPFTRNATELIHTIPTFVDAPNGDFRLTGTSVAVDFGNADRGPTVDITGAARDAHPDAGCYEYVQ